MRRWDLLILAMSLGLLVISQARIDGTPEKQALAAANPYQELPPSDYLTEYLGTMLVGGFKPLAVDFLWMKCSTLEEEKQYQEIASLLSLISKLQPWSEQVWTYIGWNLSFNIAHQAETPDDAYRWVCAGIDHVREGIARNPGSYRLKHELGFLYYFRIPQSQDLKRRIYRDTGKDCYEHAIQWFQVAKDEATGVVSRRYELDSLILDSRLHHVFECVSRHEYAGAIEEAGVTSAYAREIARTYGQNILFWTKRSRVPEESIPAIEADRSAWEAEQSGDVATARWSREEAFRRYAEILRRFEGLNLDAVDSRMEELVDQQVARDVFLRCDQGDAAGTVAALRGIMEMTRAPVPPGHPSSDFWAVVTRRLADLEECVRMEAEAQSASLGGTPEARVKWAAAVEQYKAYAELYDGFDLEWMEARQKLVETRAASAGAAPGMAPSPPPPPVPSPRRPRGRPR